MFKKKILLISILFCLCITQLSYAASFAEQVTDISGGGKISWQEAAITIEDRLNKVNGKEIKYDYSLSSKESQYLIYVCTTHQVSYTSYKNYADKFVTDYLEQNLSFTVLSEAEYNEQLEAMKRTMKNQESTNRTLIADSNFRVDKNTLPFSNLTVVGGSRGLCAGFSSLSLLAYVDPAALGKIDFAETKESGIKDNQYTIYQDERMTSSVDFKSIKEIKKKNLYSYEPEAAVLKGKIPHPALKFKGELTTENYNDYLNSFNSYNSDEVDIFSLKKKDFELLKGLHYYFSWNNYNFTKNKKSLEATNTYKSNTLCPSNELDLVLEEFKQGKPVEISIFSKNGGHSVVGYRLWQDKKDTNLFYIDVYDSNLPGNSNVVYYGYSPTLLVYKGMYGNELALYYYYAPYIKSDDTIDTHYRFTDGLAFSNYKGQILHTNNVNKWGESVELVEPIAY